MTPTQSTLLGLGAVEYIVLALPGAVEYNVLGYQYNAEVVRFVCPDCRGNSISQEIVNIGLLEAPPGTYRAVIQKTVKG